MGQRINKYTRGDYDAIVYIDGSEVIAEDSLGRKIASGVAGTDDATVIQAAVSNIGMGQIYMNRFSTNGPAYTIASTITVPVGVFIDCGGSKIDISTLNGVCFQWGSDGSFTGFVPNRSGLKNAHFVGSIANVNTVACEVINVQHGCVLEHIDTYNVAGAVHVRGASYTAKIDHVTGSFAVGNFIELSSINSAGCAPNATTITNCECSNADDAAYNNSIGIKISASVLATPAGIVISNCWLEKFLKPVYSEASTTEINDSNFIARNSGCCVHQISGASLAYTNLLVHACHMTGTPGCEGILIDNNAGTSNLRTNVTGCKIADLTTALRNVSATHAAYITFTGNIVSGCTTGIVGYIAHSTISGCHFKGIATDTAFAFGTDYTYVSISGNSFSSINIHKTPAIEILFTGNHCSTCGDVIFGTRAKINNNVFDASTITLGNSSSMVGNTIRSSASVTVGNNAIVSFNNMVGGTPTLVMGTNGVMVGNTCSVMLEITTGINCVMGENDFSVAPTIVGIGAGTLVGNNIGYTTENSGASTGTGAEQTIAHGLVSTPSRVVIEVPSIGYKGSCTFDATNIYPRVFNGVAFNWYAEVD